MILPLVLAACGPDNWGPNELRNGISSQQAKLLEKGRLEYATYCVGCHGEKGDGAGPAARFLNPKPRDLRLGRLKFGSVPANSLPTDADYLAVINHGLAGTAMPAWNLVSAEAQKALVAYVKSFYTGWQTDERVPPVAIPADPFRAHPERGIAEGEKLYHGFASCYNCHPAYVTKPKLAEYAAAANMPITEFRPALYDSVEKESDWGAPITPPDFFVDRLKFASDREHIAQVIATGVGGTAMPSWGPQLNREQLWGLAYYVDSLTNRRGTAAATEMKHALATQPEWKPAAPAAPTEVPTPSATPVKK